MDALICWLSAYWAWGQTALGGMTLPEQVLLGVTVLSAPAFLAVAWIRRLRP